ncbi:AAA family ATPase [Polaromonas jejuensis]|uniref:AAA family ATPase n=1 Tax=Polaromonas jejuensis TaxID=457502 RepID=A0ABW0QFA9_9BURK|nr:AAA family ATPase [Polaromonas jejuensis]
MEEIQKKEVSAAGGRESLVQHFAIEGLFDYRSISLESEYAATVLIARNGAGKTTMLGALDAFLRGQFGRLTSLTFRRIECRLRNVPRMLVLEKADLEQFLKTASETPDVVRVAKQHELDPEDVLFFVLWEFPVIQWTRGGLNRHPVFRKVYQHQSYTYEATLSLFNNLMQATSAAWSPVTELRQTIATALRDIEVVYLPTYRRIELSLPQTDESRSVYDREPLSIHARLGLNRRGLHAGDIQFGLADISARLKQLNQEIIIESNQKYGEISANIIDDLISGQFEEQVPSLEQRPSRQELDIFFERMKSGRRTIGYYGYYGGAFNTPDIDRIYSGNIPKNSEKFLTYFLGKLNSVIQKTRETERVVESFIKNCNRYLSAGDPTADQYGISQVDEKELRLDRSSLEVSVWRKGPRSIEIPLDALSSGEKQMVSLFARLYLYPKDKLVLIDEPELSLSIDWQQKILPDIVNASLCRQVIAITHSPFIFDNELDVFATSLRLTVDDQETSIKQ